MNCNELRAGRHGLAAAVMAVAALVLAGCVTIQNTLSPSDIQSFRLADVRVHVPAGAVLVWGDSAVEFAQFKGLPTSEYYTAANTEEGKAWMRERLASRVKEAMQQQLGGALKGGRPVIVDVSIRNFELASAVQRVLIGGSYRIVADVALLDVKTGAVIVAYPEMIHAAPALQGVAGALMQAAYDVNNPPTDRLANGFAERYREWLMKS